MNRMNIYLSWCLWMVRTMSTSSFLWTWFSFDVVVFSLKRKYFSDRAPLFSLVFSMAYLPFIHHCSPSLFVGNVIIIIVLFHIIIIVHITHAYIFLLFLVTAEKWSAFHCVEVLLFFFISFLILPPPPSSRITTTDISLIDARKTLDYIAYQCVEIYTHTHVYMANFFLYFIIFELFKNPKWKEMKKNFWLL
mgnify:CR=1 FL=1